jgi:hypothetical protein
LLGRELAVGAVEEQAREAEDGVDRRPELVAHVGHQARLDVGRPAKGVVLLVELRVQALEPLVGLGELAAGGLEIRLPVARGHGHEHHLPSARLGREGERGRPAMREQAQLPVVHALVLHALEERPRLGVAPGIDHRIEGLAHRALAAAKHLLRSRVQPAAPAVRRAHHHELGAQTLDDGPQ